MGISRDEAEDDDGSGANRTKEPILALHEQLFGWRPKKDGTAYERLTALVLAVLGWEEVKQESHEQPPGDLAKQILDVVARHPNGARRRLIVQCKHYKLVIGKGIMDTLVGVGVQLGDVDLAVITTERFTRGARAVAVDRNIAMVMMRPYDPARDAGRFYTRVEVSIAAVNPPDISNVLPELGAVEGAPIATHLTANTQVRLERDDGLPAETIAELMEAHGRWVEVGEFDRDAVPEERRWIPLDGGGRVELRRLTWHQVITAGEPVVAVTEKEGEPVLVVEQLGADGKPASGRLVVDQDLWAWDLDDENQVVLRGRLSGAGPDST
jgi:hypothetical protein